MGGRCYLALESHLTHSRSNFCMKTKANKSCFVSYTWGVQQVRSARGLNHRLEDGSNIIFQYNPPLIQCF